MSTFKLGYQEVSVDLILPGRHQPRHFGPDDKKDIVLVGMSESIKQDGVVEPAIVRNHPDKPGFVELGAGERRLRASKLAGKKTVPCIVREMDDDTLFRICVVENVQREDLRPLEEAHAYQAALSRGWNLEQCAREFGYSKRHIALRAQLTKLSDKWTAQVSDRKTVYSQWPVSALEMIACLAHPSQNELFDHHRFRSTESVPTPAEVRNVINSVLKVIKLAPWKEEDATIGRACTGCEQRDDAQPELFDPAEFTDASGKKAKNGEGCARCLNTACWHEKTIKLIKKREAELKKEHKQVLFVGNSYNAPPAFRKNMMQIYQLSECPKTAADAIPAICVNEYNKVPGTVIWVKKPKVSTSTSTSTRKSSTPAGPPPSSLRANHVAEAITKELEKRQRDAKNAQGMKAKDCLLAIAADVMPDEELAEAKTKNVDQLAYQLFRETSFYLHGGELKKERTKFEVLCTALGLDLINLENEALKKFPDAPAAAKKVEAPAAKAKAKKAKVSA